MHPTRNYDASSGVDRPMIPNSTEFELLSFDTTSNFIDSWLQTFKTNYA